jgi:hypothetical protein
MQESRFGEDGAEEAGVCGDMSNAEEGDHRYGGEVRKPEDKMAQYRSFLKKREKNKNMRIST